MPHHVECPNCGSSVKWHESSPWRPFCSERCKMIDLGAWFSEERAIPGPEALDLPEELDDDVEPLLSGRPGGSSGHQ